MSNRENMEIGQRIADFELPSLEGELVRLSDFRGKPTIVFMWASW